MAISLDVSQVAPPLPVFDVTIVDPDHEYGVAGIPVVPGDFGFSSAVLSLVGATVARSGFTAGLQYFPETGTVLLTHVTRPDIYWRVVDGVAAHANVVVPDEPADDGANPNLVALMYFPSDGSGPVDFYNDSGGVGFDVGYDVSSPYRFPADTTGGKLLFMYSQFGVVSPLTNDSSFADGMKFRCTAFGF